MGAEGEVSIGVVEMDSTFEPLPLSRVSIEDDFLEVFILSNSPRRGLFDDVSADQHRSIFDGVLVGFVAVVEGR